MVLFMVAREYLWSGNFLALIVMRAVGPACADAVSALMVEGGSAASQPLEYEDAAPSWAPRHVAPLWSSMPFAA
jgi:hypothetical protein